MNHAPEKCLGLQYSQTGFYRTTGEETFAVITWQISEERFWQAVTFRGILKGPDRFSCGRWQDGDGASKVRM